MICVTLSPATLVGLRFQACVQRSHAERNGFTNRAANHVWSGPVNA